MFARPSKERHPFHALVLLIAIACAGFVIFSSLALYIGYLMYGSKAISLSADAQSVHVQKLLLAFYSIGTFVIPPFVYARVRSITPFDFLDIRMPKPWILLLIGIAIMLAATPFIEWTIYINQKMKLPFFLERIETWMKYKEIEAEILTKQLLVMRSIPDLLTNLLVIAVIPAVGEELLFRGCIQKIFTRLFNNYHAGIWIAAIIFSTIHLQFYGFIPRMLLGALFGYMFVFSKSIWVPVLAHFFNNASAVIGAFMLQREGKTLENLTKPIVQQGYLVVLSVIFTALLFIVYQKMAARDTKDWA